jgi:glutamyl-Q tRNA(Asp) synthetase
MTVPLDSVPSDFPSRRYTGRFAPSPTGPLHFGSLVAALASWLDARAHGGQWLLRIEDIDPAREQPGAAAAIPTVLAAHGLRADGAIVHQGARIGHYRAALQQLLDSGDAFYCSCSRSDLLACGGVHRGRCNDRRIPPEHPHAVRLLVGDAEVAFDDRLQGHQWQRLADAVGDFVLWRKEALPAYQLAVVVDDAWQGVTDIVRGSDLLDNTPRQILLQQKLGLPTPRYAHLPVIVNRDGQKLSKQNLARPLDPARAVDNLRAALAFLGQPQPPQQLSRDLDALLAWSVERWQLASVPALLQRDAEALPPALRALLD